MKYAAGAAKSSASMRSSTPPWPPSSVPVSFTLHVPLEHRLEQVAERRRDREHRAEHERLGIERKFDS